MGTNKEKYHTIIPNPFIKYGEKNRSHYRELEKEFNKARFEKPFEVFLGSLIFFTLIVSIVSFALSFYFLYYILRYVQSTSLIFSLLFTFFVTPVFFGIYHHYPQLKSRKLKRKLEAELRPAIRFMLNEIKNGKTPYKTFEELSRSNLEGIGREARYVVRLVDEEGKTFLNSIVQCAKQSPSEEFKSFLFSLNGAIRSKESVVSFLKSQLD